MLLKLGADPNAQAHGDLWECPLHVAVRGRFTACVKVLLDFGADVNAMNQFKETPLHVGAEVSPWSHIAHGTFNQNTSNREAPIYCDGMAAREDATRSHANRLSTVDLEPLTTDWVHQNGSDAADRGS